MSVTLFRPPMRPVLLLLTLAGLVWMSGCVAPPPGAKVQAEKPPFAYEPLGVPNSCFVESVHFYDTYLAKHRGGDSPWARVLEWGNEEEDLRISSGHAVTIFVAKERLWYYDVNFGVVPLPLPLDRRADITDVSPKIFERYPQFRPILARYREDYSPVAEPKRPDYLFYHKNPDVRHATRVANELGRVRPVRVIEFELKTGEQVETTAATAFSFGRRVCVYFPRQGTFETRRYVGSADDLRFLSAVVKRLYPNASNVRWQPGGYLLFPGKKES